MTDNQTAATRRIASPASSTHVKYIAFILVVFIALSTFHLLFTWKNYNQEAEQEAIILAQSLEAMIHPEHLAELSGSPGDMEKIEYTLIKNDLIRLVQTTNQIRFAYVLGLRDDHLTILADSEDPDSVDYAPPGLLYTEADPILRDPFQSGQSVLTPPYTDRWGSWVSALVPVVHQDTSQIISVFAIDFSTAEWRAHLYRQMIPDVMIVVFMFALLMIIFYVWKQKTTLKQMSQVLAYEEALYRNMFSQAPIGVALVKGCHFVSQTIHGSPGINPMGEKILGRSNEALGSITWPDITYPDDLPSNLKQFEQFESGLVDGYTLEKRFIKPDGSIVWTDIHVSRLRGLPDEQDLHLLLIEDITAFKKEEQKLIESERSKSVMLSNLPGMAYRCHYDQDWTMQFVSNGCLELTGYHADQLIANRKISYNQIIKPEYRDMLFQEWAKVTTERKPFRKEYEITTAAGESKWVYELGEAIYNDTGAVEALAGIILDISDRKSAENQLRFAAEHDLWTGLYNRSHLELILNRDAHLPLREKRAVIGINLSSMYALSLSYGFSYSQTVLRKITGRLSRHSHQNRILFSSYEYRYVFYVKGYRGRDELESFCDTIAGEISPILGSERLGGGIGVLEIDESNRSDVEMMLKNVLLATEIAMKSEEADVRVQFFDLSLAEQIRREENIERELVDISNDTASDRLYLLFQPVLDLKKDKICGFEALARLNSQYYGLVPPNEFIPIAEKSKLIIQLGDVIIFKALQFLKKLQSQGLGHVSVSINISAIQLLRADFSKNLIDKITRWRINPANVGLELTESIFASNYDEINRIVRSLREIGMKILIDDFGTGYSSLAREHEIYANCLKIDKHFIDKLLDASPDKAITSDIIAMGHKLGHSVIAEGVEYESQMQYLKDHGCDMIQGYLISKPLQEDLAIERMNQYNNGVDC